MNYPKKFKSLLFLACISFNAFAELTPYTATYAGYSGSFHIADATQTLEKLGDNWLIKLHTEAVGFARFIQGKPITQEHIFQLYQHQALLLSAKSDSGKADENAKKSAYYDRVSKQLFIKTHKQSTSIQLDRPLSSYLAFTTTLSNILNNPTQTLSFYDKGKVVQKAVAYLGMQNGFKVIEVGKNNSKKKLRYLFKPDTMQVPFRIEKIKKGKLKAYLELTSFITH